MESATWIVHHFLRVIPTGSRSQVFHTFATVFRLLPDCFRLFPGCFSLQPRLTETFAIPTETLVFGVTFDYSICFRHPTLWFAPTAFAYCPKLSSQLGSHWFCLYMSNVADMVSFFCNVVSCLQDSRSPAFKHGFPLCQIGFNSWAAQLM